jgi:hypothetical protein
MGWSVIVTATGHPQDLQRSRAPKPAALMCPLGTSEVRDMTRRFAIPTVAVLTVLLAAVSASAARMSHVKRATCPPAHSEVLLADGQAQIFTVEQYERLEGVTGPQRFFPTGHLLLQGCAHGQKRSYELGEYCSQDAEEGTAQCEGAKPVSLVGTKVAYGDELVSEDRYQTSEGFSEWRVIVRDLRTGRILHDVPMGAALRPDPEYVGVGPAVAIVVRSDGAVAWIAEDYERSSGAGTSAEVPYFDVYAADKSGTRLLASGFDVNPSSLALAGDTLYWTQNGQPVSAALH